MSGNDLAAVVDSWKDAVEWYAVFGLGCVIFVALLGVAIIAGAIAQLTRAVVGMRRVVQSQVGRTWRG